MSDLTADPRGDAQHPGETSVDPALTTLIDQIAVKLAAGERVDTEDYAQRYPAYAGNIRRLLPTLHDLVAFVQVVNRERCRTIAQNKATDTLDHQC